MLPHFPLLQPVMKFTHFDTLFALLDEKAKIHVCYQMGRGPKTA